MGAARIPFRGAAPNFAGAPLSASAFTVSGCRIPGNHIVVDAAKLSSIHLSTPG